MKTCKNPNCRAENPDDANFCSKCRSEFINKSTGSGSSSYSPKRTSSYKWVWVLVAAIVIILILIIANNGQTATYLTTNVQTLNFDAGGSTKTITVSTDGSSYDVSLLPSWCSVSNKTATSFQIECQRNTGTARSDYFLVSSDSREARIDVEQTARTATYLITGTQRLSFDAGGSTKTITVSTDGSSYDVSLLPSWCSVSNKMETSFQIECQRNTGTARSDYFIVSSDSKEKQIDVEQAAGVRTPSATIENILVDHNFAVGYNIYGFVRYGMQIHVKFSVNNMMNKQGQCVAYFYQRYGDILLDNNRQYYAQNGQVSVGISFTPLYEGTKFERTLILPYDELHLGKGNHNLKFDVMIFDSNGNKIAESNFVDFTYYVP